MTSKMVPQAGDMAQVLAGPEGDFLRRGLEQLLRQVMEAEVTAQVGAGLHERSETVRRGATATGRGSGRRAWGR